VIYCYILIISYYSLYIGETYGLPTRKRLFREILKAAKLSDVDRSSVETGESSSSNSIPPRSPGQSQHSQGKASRSSGENAINRWNKDIELLPDFNEINDSRSSSNNRYTEEQGQNMDSADEDEYDDGDITARGDVSTDKTELGQKDSTPHTRKQSSTSMLSMHSKADGEKASIQRSNKYLDFFGKPDLVAKV
jgi:hypothetical protein